jgi:DNA polymerase (family 10)
MTLYSDCFEGPPSDGSGSGGDGDTPQKGRFSLAEVTDLNNTTGNDLVRPCDIKGILHSHSRYTDGVHPLASMINTAQEIGLEYLGISDHFRSEAHQEGLDLSAVKVQRQEIDILREKFSGFDILQGVELDANPDGSLPLDDGTLLLFDYVIVSFPENGGYDRETLTSQAVRVASHPLVTILGQPVGDCILHCKGEHLDMPRVLAAAAAGNTAVEVNANPTALELDWKCCLEAQEMGVYMAISPNAHRAARLVDYRHGAELAHDAGLRCGSILNTMSSKELRGYLSRNHHS